MKDILRAAAEATANYLRTSSALKYKLLFETDQAELATAIDVFFRAHLISGDAPPEAHQEAALVAARSVSDMLAQPESDLGGRKTGCARCSDH